MAETSVLCVGSVCLEGSINDREYMCLHTEVAESQLAEIIKEIFLKAFGDDFCEEEIKGCAEIAKAVKRLKENP